MEFRLPVRAKNSSNITWPRWRLCVNWRDKMAEALVEEGEQRLDDLFEVIFISSSHYVFSPTGRRAPVGTPFVTSMIQVMHICGNITL